MEIAKGCFSKKAMSASRYRIVPTSIPFLIRELIPSSTAGAIIAPGGTGKSTFTMQMALQIATYEVTKLPFLDAFPIEGGGRVLYLSGEDGDKINHPRIHFNMGVIAEKTGIDEEVLWNKLEENFLIPDFTGESEKLTITESGQVKPTAMYNRLATVVQTFKPVVIILDTKSRFSGLTSENDNSQAAKEVKLLEALALPYNATLIIVHHTPRSNNGIARGATAFTDNIRWQINLSPNGEKIDVKNTKQNYGKKVPDFTISRVDDYWFESTGEVCLQENNTLDTVVAMVSSLNGLECTQSKVIKMVQEADSKISRRKIMDAIQEGLEKEVLKNNGSRNGMKLVVNGKDEELCIEMEVE